MIESQPSAGGFIRVCALSDLPDEGAIGIEVDGEPVEIGRAHV